jgi:hypothetical protein
MQFIEKRLDVTVVLEVYTIAVYDWATPQGTD